MILIEQTEMVVGLSYTFRSGCLLGAQTSTWYPTIRNLFL